MHAYKLQLLCMQLLCINKSCMLAVTMFACSYVCMQFIAVAMLGHIPRVMIDVKNTGNYASE